MHLILGHLWDPNHPPSPFMVQKIFQPAIRRRIINGSLFPLRYLRQSCIIQRNNKICGGSQDSAYQPGSPTNSISACISLTPIKEAGRTARLGTLVKQVSELTLVTAALHPGHLCRSLNCQVKCHIIGSRTISKMTENESVSYTSKRSQQIDGPRWDCCWRPELERWYLKAPRWAASRKQLNTRPQYSVDAKCKLSVTASKLKTRTAR